MLFNSYEFLLLFLPLVLLTFFVLSPISRDVASGWLALSSLIFYAWWSPKYTLLLIVSVLVNYLTGREIARRFGQRSAKYITAAGVAFNLVLLGFFKYVDFAIDSVNMVSAANLAQLNIILPIGISFYTFTQIAFLVDAYKGLAREYRFAHFLLFVTYFPHLIAGPVLHHKQMMPQFASEETYRIRCSNIAVGLLFFTMGLAKKVLVADSFAPFATSVFDGVATGGHPTLLVAWLGALAYTFQIYFDFSGYSDMALGISRLFGIKLPVNFNSPYKARSITDFWRRWHITLSTFLRDYLYFPLGGNRRGAVRRYVNLLITMLLGGLWHGASWTFVIWGGLHGLFLAINHFWSAISKYGKLNAMRGNIFTRVGSWALTFLAVVFAWVVFRADNVSTALELLKAMLGGNGVVLPSSLQQQLGSLGAMLHSFGFQFQIGVMTVNGNPVGSTLEFAALCLLTIVLLKHQNSQQIAARFEQLFTSQTVSRSNGSLVVVTAASAATIFFICLLSLNKKTEFLYFQF
jgi:alginate O-acetyltransferase complex protein AlgI